MKRDNVVVMLLKNNPGVQWSHVTAAEKRSVDAKQAKKPDMADGKDPSAGLMDMMRQMYEDGDDDMKRTIAKAWTESRDKKQDGPGSEFGI